MAFALWVASLALPALRARGDTVADGFFILITGWFVPVIEWNVAWLANPLLIRSYLKLRSGRAPGIAAVAGALLALDTFRLTFIPLDEGGGRATLYGYAPGAIVWLLAVFLMAVAAGRREAEVAEQGETPDPEAVFAGRLGALLAATLLLSAGGLAAFDRATGSPTELRRLEGVVFKRGRICRAPDPAINERTQRLSGALEVIDAGSEYPGYPPYDHRTLLDWGVPVVRINGYDYAYRRLGEETVLVAEPARGPAAADLIVQTAPDRVTMTIEDIARGRRVLDQTWDLGDFPCPDYFGAPAPTQPPRSTILALLGLPADPPPDLGAQLASTRRALPPKQGTVTLEQPAIAGAFDLSSNLQQLPAAEAALQIWTRSNKDCAVKASQRVAYAGASIPETQGLADGAWFVVDRTAFALEGGRAICEANAVTLTTTSTEGASATSMMTRRLLPSLEHEWSAAVRFPANGLVEEGQWLVVEEVRRDAGGLQFKVRNAITGASAEVRAPAD